MRKLVVRNIMSLDGYHDEPHLMIAPVVLGGGTLLFGSRPSAALRLLDAQTWPGSGLVLARYEILGNKM